MRFIIGTTALVLLMLNSCAKPLPQAPSYTFEPPDRQLDYFIDVEPILVKRCVVCHSCYNSPCQLKLSSWERLEAIPAYQSSADRRQENGFALESVEKWLAWRYVSDLDRLVSSA